jgi:hypothetical protein
VYSLLNNAKVIVYVRKAEDGSAKGGGEDTGEGTEWENGTSGDQRVVYNLHSVVLVDILEHRNKN